MKNDSIIRLGDAVKEMATGKPFSAEWVSYDVRRGGGEIESYPELRMLRAESGIVGNTHWKNFTRNFEKLVQGENVRILVKIHLPLLLTFNGKKIIL